MGRTGRILCGVIAVALWGSAFAAITVALDAFHPFTLVPVRLGIAATALLIASFWRPVPLPRLRTLPRIVGCAAVGMVGYQLLLNLGEVDVPAGTASMIIAAAPLAAAIMVRQDRSDRTPRSWWWASSVCIAGVVLVCIDAAGTAPLDAIGALVIAAIIYGLYAPLLKPLLADHDGFTVTTHITVTAAIMSTPLLLTHPIPPHDVTATEWGAAIYLGIGPSATAFLLWRHPCDSCAPLKRVPYYSSSPCSASRLRSSPPTSPSPQPPPSEAPSSSPASAAPCAAPLTLEQQFLDPGSSTKTPRTSRTR